jgi:4-hydroxybenzoate polyprenyltransferase
VHVYHWWHVFDAAGISQYARQCHVLFDLMMVWPCLVSVILAIVTAAGIVAGILAGIRFVVGTVSEPTDDQFDKTVPEMGEV